MKFLLSYVSSYLALIVLCFITSLTFSYGVGGIDTVPRVIFLLCQLQLILSLSASFDVDDRQGILELIRGLGEKIFEKYVIQKLLKSLLMSSLFTTFVGAFSLFLWTSLELMQVLYWALMLFITGLFTSQMSLIMSALRLGSEQSSILGLFVIFPFVIPPLIFAQSGFDMLLDGRSFMDYFYFNCGVSLITLGMGLVLTPKILRQALAT